MLFTRHSLHICRRSKRSIHARLSPIDPVGVRNLSQKKSNFFPSNQNSQSINWPTPQKSTGATHSSSSNHSEHLQKEENPEILVVVWLLHCSLCAGCKANNTTQPRRVQRIYWQYIAVWSCHSLIFLLACFAFTKRKMELPRQKLVHDFFNPWTCTKALARGRTVRLTGMYIVLSPREPGGYDH